MNRTITVKGVASVSAKVDYVVLSMSLNTFHRKYDKAMEIAATNIQNLNETLTSVGFDEESIKTVNFDVSAKYESIEDNKGVYKHVFKGYEIEHELKLSFDFESERLSKTLSSISDCISHPEISIRFTVKDTSSINEEMLRMATINAKKTAQILCDASGVTLGNLLSISYNWDEINVYSDTDYTCCNIGSTLAEGHRHIKFEPDDINARDTATFVWEVK